MQEAVKEKICILALHLGTGGVESSVAFLSNMLCQKYDVTIVCTYKLPNTPAVKINDNVKIEYLTENLEPNKEQFLRAVKEKKITKILKEGFFAVKILFLKKYKMVKKIKQLDSKIIISTRYNFSKWLGKYGKKETIKIAQEHNHHNNNKKYIRQVVKSLKNIDYFMPVSQELTDFYSEHINNKKTKCIYIPHGLEYYPEQTADLKNKNIISVGRLVSVKGFLELIDIFKDIILKAPDWTLNIVGAGEQYNELNKKIIDLGLEKNVFLLGNKNRDELNNIFSESSIYVMTSYTEAFGLVLIEAESFGIPLIAFDSAQGAKEIIKDNNNGFIISNRNRQEMINKILTLINNEELRNAMGQAGRKLSEKYREDNIFNEWSSFLESII